MRINKYLADQGLTTRRGADDFIRNGHVTINGRTAVLGDQVEEGDIVEVTDAIKKSNAEKIYVAYNKPIGIVTNLPQQDEQSIEDVTHFPWKIFAIGRLDKDSHGLLIMTNDGRITDRLLNPDKTHEKEYVVEVNKPLNARAIRNLEHGVILDDGYKTEPCQAEMIDTHTFRIILTEGKKRQIRRMCSAVGYEVVDLERVRIMNITSEGIEEGNFRRIRGEQLTEFLKLLGL